MAPLCQALGISRSGVYRLIEKSDKPKTAKRSRPKQALTETERQNVLGVMHEDRFVDLSPAQVFATLLDEGKYLCSIRTMYRILEKEGETRERRRQLRHPVYSKPELLATGPKELWSWDITCRQRVFNEV